MNNPKAVSPETRILKLYAYQDQQVEFLLGPTSKLEDPRWRMLVGPTSSGKSAVIKTAVRLAIARGLFSTALVLTSRRSLEESLKRSEVYERESGEVVEFPADLWTELRNGNSAVAWNPGVTGIWTQQGAVRIAQDDTTSLSHAVVIVDEAHHHGAGTELYRWLVRAWERGATIWSFTGTPERNDGLPLCPVDPDVTVLAQTTLMRLGWPKRVVFTTLRMRSPADQRARGELLDSDYEALVSVLTESTRRTLVAVTPGNSVMLAENLERNLRAAGVKDRILITTGTDTVESELGSLPRAIYVERVLEADRKLLDEGRVDETLRYMIDCRRCVEGMDAPGLSRLVSYGVPTSLQALIQRLGRLMRRKDQIPGFDPEHRDTVEVIFAVPETADDARARAAAVAQLIQIACYLNAPDVSHDYMEFWNDIVRNQRLPPYALQAMRERERLPEETALLNRRVLELGVPGYGRRALNFEDLLGNVEKHAESPEEALSLLERMLQYGAEAEPAILDKMKTALHDAYQIPILPGTPEDRDRVAALYNNALFERFKAIAQEYADLVVPIERRMLRGLEGALTPELIEKIGRDMAQARDAVYDKSIDEIADIIDGFKAKHGRNVGEARGVDDDLSEFVGFVYSLSDLERSIRRQWPGMDIAKLVVIHRAHGLRGVVDPFALRNSWPKGYPAPDAARVKILLGQGASALATEIARTKARDVRVLAGQSAVCLAIAAYYGWRGLPVGSLPAILALGSPATLVTQPVRT